MAEGVRKVLFIRRDNIGDLVCTTPAIRALRLSYPGARIAVLVNSYNADAIRGNPDVDAVFVYEKGKHRMGRSFLKVLASNLMVLARIRRERFDFAIGCSNAFSKRVAEYAWATGARHRIGYVPASGGRGSRLYDMPMAEPPEPLHEVEAVMRLLRPLGVEGPAPAMTVRPGKDDLARAAAFLGRMGAAGSRTAVFHISSRRSRNRWPKESFLALARKVEDRGFRVVLMWAPGSKDNPLHPGDDEEAEWLLTAMPRAIAFRTGSLGDLSAALSLSDIVVCCDGGAMHMAAGLGKPVLTIWGSTDPRRWAPWGVAHRIVTKGTSAGEVGPEEAFSGFESLCSEVFGKGSVA